MARKYVIIDDISGEEFQPGTDEGQEGVVLSFNGERVSLDLAHASIEGLRELLRPYFDKGEEVQPEPIKPARRQLSGGVPPSRVDREQAQAMREWGRANGFTVSDRGRIPVTLQEAYDRRDSRGKATKPAIPATSKAGQRNLREEANALLASSKPAAKDTQPRPPLPTREEMEAEHKKAEAKRAELQGTAQVPSALFPSSDEVDAEHQRVKKSAKQARPATAALFSAAPTHPADSDSSSDLIEHDQANTDDDTPTKMDVTRAGLDEWLRNNGHNPDGMRYLTKLKLFKQGHPNTEINYKKETA